MESNTLKKCHVLSQQRRLQPVQAAPYMLHLGVGPSLATLSLSIDIIGVVRSLACGFVGFGNVVAAEK